MAVDTDNPRVKALMRLTRDLHNRRNGRFGSRVWDRTSSRIDEDLRPGLDFLMKYRKGDPPLPTGVHEGWAAPTRQYVRTGRFNIGGLLISSTRNRMDLRDFRTAAAGDEQGDIEARRIMLANELDVRARDLHDYLLTMADSYTMTLPGQKGDEQRTGGGSEDYYARITAEDPREVITDDDPVTGKPRRGLKLFRDDWDAADFAYLWLPGEGLTIFRKDGSTSIRTGSWRFDKKGWQVDEDLTDKAKPVVEAMRGIIPFVHFQNADGVGEFEAHLDTLDRINDKVFNEWWIGKIQAHRQRAIKGLPDKDEETGEDIDYKGVFSSDPGALWQVPEGTDFWESGTTDMSGITQSIKEDLIRLATATSQALHTITPDAADGSAEGASLMREEHLYKIGDRISRVNRRWCQTMSLAFAIQGDRPRADLGQLEAIWGPHERFSLSQRADAASKLRGITPLEAIWTDVLQYDPKDVPRLRELRGKDLIADAVLAAASAAPAPTPQRQTPGGPTPAPVRDEPVAA